MVSIDRISPDNGLLAGVLTVNQIIARERKHQNFYAKFGEFESLRSVFPEHKAFVFHTENIE